MQFFEFGRRENDRFDLFNDRCFFTGTEQIDPAGNRKTVRTDAYIRGHLVFMRPAGFLITDSGLHQATLQPAPAQGKTGKLPAR